MGRFFPSRFSYRARSKSKGRSAKKISWLAAFFLVASLFSLFSILAPSASGKWGGILSDLFTRFAGKGAIFLPLGGAYVSSLLLFKGHKHLRPLRVALSSGLYLFGLIFITVLGNAIWSENFGGLLGEWTAGLFQSWFGKVGAGIISLGGAVTLTIFLIGTSPSEVIRSLVAALVRDWAEWQKTRAAKAPKEAAVKEPKAKPAKAPPVVPANEELSKPLPKSQPKIMNMAADLYAGDLAKSDAEPKITRKAEKPAPAAPKAGEKVEAAAASTRKIDYKSPSLDIFESVTRSQPVAKEELTARANLLEQTLRNFNISARVVEIHPGPVITRYDLEPAPGVKVASIASRADDLALAMRSTGIRVLAPIPGKGAVGVEIPNSHPESVTLKELLARPEFINHPSPLAFVLGKTVSGEPYIVDLAAMPHMLVAGATGAGKSVCVHAMISSILYRMPPDLVKFTLIDPKRLELPSYSGIPHLYDPRVGPLQAEVITNPKQAAKALVRLVKVMEYRYDLFAKANVRNIDSFNKKQKAAGQPPAYYLVVIIDELADLMLTAPKEVEDSVQRLAQMARAVGIHLVLATQRPSVDVITGVIKANLPARIALRVASAIDSRVIVDTIGAESLLGKGDMLFLPPASPEPLRAQGAFVSEGEVEKLVAHVKQFGLPFYDDLFSSGSALEFAVEDKKEMKDLIEALKLVLERKRVSQDLLKAHFGSSARATNILSLLEVKQFITKPEGTNRWEINFDMIEDFIAKVNNIPEGELAQ